MISKEYFVRIMWRLEALDGKMNDVDSAMKRLSSDFCNFYITDAIDISISILEEVFNDADENWLSYFVWECDWLQNFNLGDIEVDGEPVEIESWADVYDFLIQNMEDNK